MASENELKIDMIKSLMSSIESKINKLPVDQSDSYRACIRVPAEPPKVNEAAFVPRLVSIGPLHRDKCQQLHAMESYKIRCLQNFRIRFGVGLHDLVTFVVHEESYVRQSYEDTINLSPERFSEMILFDGIFIVELFLKNHFVHLRERSDTIFEDHSTWNDLLHDLLLLGNQLPMKVTEDLFMFVDKKCFRKNLTIYDLAHEFFKNVGNTEKLPLTENYRRARHFVEFLQYLHRPAHPRDQPLPAATKFEYTRSATELQQAGVVFRCGTGSSLFNAEFSEGVLTIPSFTVNHSTETFFRNIIAFERHSTDYSKDITSYVILMDGLINTGEDVILLDEHEIIRNELGESEAVADLFNSLHKEVVTGVSDFYFAKLCGDLNEYSRNSFNWRRKLKFYFSNPWFYFFIAAVGVIWRLFLPTILSVIQTVSSIIQVKQGAKSSSGN